MSRGYHRKRVKIKMHGRKKTLEETELLGKSQQEAESPQTCNKKEEWGGQGLGKSEVEFVKGKQRYCSKTDLPYVEVSWSSESSLGSRDGICFCSACSLRSITTSGRLLVMMVTSSNAHEGRVWL